MAEDLAEAIVLRAVVLMDAEEASRSRKLIVSRGAATAWASFKGDGDHHVRIAISLTGKPADAFTLRYMRDSTEAPTDVLESLVRQMWWMHEHAEPAFRSNVDVVVRIEGEPACTMMMYSPGILASDVAASRGFTSRLRLLMRIV